MKIEILVYSYLAVCLAMIGFNIVCIFLFSRNDRETEHSRLYYINLIKGQFGKETLDERHRLLILLPNPSGKRTERLSPYFSNPSGKCPLR